MSGVRSTYISAVPNGDGVLTGYGTGTSAAAAFQYYPGGSYSGIAPIPGYGNGTYALGGSLGGTYVTGVCVGISNQHAFLYSANSGTIDLGTLSGTSGSSTAYAVSADGTVVVGRTTSSSGTQAFRWTKNGGMIGLGRLPGGSISCAMAVSHDGSYVTGYASDPSGTQIFRSYGTVMQKLNNVLGATSGCGTGISVDGKTVVGYATFSNKSTEAIVWRNAIGSSSVKDLLSSAGVTGVQGWTLTKCTGVSDDGMTIVGSGIDPAGHQEGWVATLNPLASLTFLQIPNFYPSMHPFTHCMSGDGSFVGGSDQANLSDLDTWMWTTTGGATNFLKSYSYTAIPDPEACSFDGSVVVGGEANPSAQAIRWTAAGGIQPLGFLPTSNSYDATSYAFACSKDGSVIVGDSTADFTAVKGDYGIQAFRYTAASGMKGLGSFSPGVSGTQASACSWDGNYIAGADAMQDSYQREAWVWTQGSGLTSLGQPQGSTWCNPTAISYDGSTVVGIAKDASGNQNLVKYSELTGWITLGLDAASPHYQTGVASASADADVIVEDDDLIWTPDWGTLSVENALQRLGCTVPAGIYKPRAVAADGQTLTGDYYTSSDIYYLNGVPFVAHLFWRPVANDDSYVALGGTSLTESAPGVMANDYHHRGGTVVLVQAPQHSVSFSLNADGSFQYTPDVGFFGSDSFTYYCVKDGFQSRIATATIYVSPFVYGLSRQSVPAGTSDSGSILLMAPAGVGGATINLTSTSPLFVQPAPIVVPEGLKTASFSFNLQPSDVASLIQVNASYNGYTLTLPLMVKQPKLRSFTSQIVTVFSGTTHTAALTFDGKFATPQSIPITVPNLARVNGVLGGMSVVLPAGSMVMSCRITVSPADQYMSGLEDCVAALNGMYRAVPFNDLPAQLTSATFGPASVVGGSQAYLYLGFNGTTTSGEKATISSSDSSVATVTSPWTLADNTSSNKVTVTTKPVTSTQMVTITIIVNGVTKQATLTVTPS